MTVFSDNETAELEEANWHRTLAKRTYNAAWELIGEPGRTPADDRRMLLLACASRVHWGEAGGSREHAVGDWQVAHVLSLLGAGELALSFARSAMAVVEEHGWNDFMLASAHEGMARAYAVMGETAERDAHANRCREVLATLPQEDRELIAGQLASVPGL